MNNEIDEYYMIHDRLEMINEQKYFSNKQSKSSVDVNENVLCKSSSDKNERLLTKNILSGEFLHFLFCSLLS